MYNGLMLVSSSGPGSHDCQLTRKGMMFSLTSIVTLGATVISIEGCLDFEFSVLQITLCIGGNAFDERLAAICLLVEYRGGEAEEHED
ncbi:hypothetical protein Fmac_020101 [Flemingia macrophylla]|uniref:Uncharacterized protein n=1 Tax=Flemingia macrophylla TaxID=520843 RepID=A0ABD1M9P8_9FABA